MPKHVDSLTRRVLAFMAEDEGRYTLGFLAGHFDVERDALKHLVYAMVYRGHVQGHRYERATQKGDRKVYEITAEGREYLWEREHPVPDRAGHKGPETQQSSVRAFAFAAGGARP